MKSFLLCGKKNPSTAKTKHKRNDTTLKMPLPELLFCIVLDYCPDDDLKLDIIDYLCPSYQRSTTALLGDMEENQSQIQRVMEKWRNASSKRVKKVSVSKLASLVDSWHLVIKTPLEWAQAVTEPTKIWSLKLSKSEVIVPFLSSFLFLFDLKKQKPRVLSSLLFIFIALFTVIKCGLYFSVFTRYAHDRVC